MRKNIYLHWICKGFDPLVKKDLSIIHLGISELINQLWGVGKYKRLFLVLDAYI